MIFTDRKKVCVVREREKGPEKYRARRICVWGGNVSVCGETGEREGQERALYIYRVLDVLDGGRYVCGRMCVRMREFFGFWKRRAGCVSERECACLCVWEREGSRGDNH